MFKGLFFIFFIFPFFVQAQNIETVFKEIQLKTANKQEAQAKALNELSRKLVIEMIGMEKYKKERQRIRDFIIKNQNRYILSTSSSQPVLQDDGSFSSTVTIKVSKENLKDLLLEHNLFYTSKGSFCLLPVVSFVSYFEEEKRNYSWWLKEGDEEPSPLLRQMAKSFFKMLSEELIKHGFYALDPVFQKMDKGTPTGVLPKKSSRVRNFVPLAKFYTCDIILSGHIHIGESLPSSSGFFSLFSKDKEPSAELIHSKYFTQFFLNVFNIESRQFLFKLKKQFPLSYSLKDKKQIRKEVFMRSKDVLAGLTYQLSSYQEEGSLDLNRLIISVQGPLTYAQKEQLKEILVKKVSGLESLQERFLTSNRVVYSAESSQSTKAIAKQLKKLSLKKFVIQLKGYKKRELEIYARKK